MDRRDFLKSGLIGAGVAIAAPSVALADHVVESTEPIIGIGLHLYHYTNRQATFQSVMQIIPEDGVQPPGSYPVTVQIQENGTAIGSLQAYETKVVAPALPIDAATGLPIVNFNMRLEPKVAIGSAGRKAGTPSEHWTELLKVSEIVERNHKKYLWAVPWQHANTGPHKRFSNPAGYAETSQANQSLQLIPPGTRLLFEHEMVCLESGRVFSQSISVITAAAVEGS